MVQYQAILCSLELRELYLQLHFNVTNWFRHQQNLHPQRSSLIVYQLVAWQSLADKLEMIEMGLQSLAFLPFILEQKRLKMSADLIFHRINFDQDWASEHSRQFRSSCNSSLRKLKDSTITHIDELFHDSESLYNASLNSGLIILNHQIKRLSDNRFPSNRVKTIVREVQSYFHRVWKNEIETSLGTIFTITQSKHPRRLSDAIQLPSFADLPQSLIVKKLVILINALQCIESTFPNHGENILCERDTTHNELQESLLAVIDSLAMKLRLVLANADDAHITSIGDDIEQTVVHALKAFGHQYGQTFHRYQLATKLPIGNHNMNHRWYIYNQITPIQLFVSSLSVSYISTVNRMIDHQQRCYGSHATSEMATIKYDVYHIANELSALKNQLLLSVSTRCQQHNDFTLAYACNGGMTWNIQQYCFSSIDNRTDADIALVQYKERVELESVTVNAIENMLALIPTNASHYDPEWPTIVNHINEMFKWRLEIIKTLSLSFNPLLNHKAKAVLRRIVLLQKWCLWNSSLKRSGSFEVHRLAITKIWEDLRNYDIVTISQRYPSLVHHTIADMSQQWLQCCLMVPSLEQGLTVSRTDLDTRFVRLLLCIEQTTDIIMEVFRYSFWGKLLATSTATKFADMLAETPSQVRSSCDNIKDTNLNCVDYFVFYLTKAMEVAIMHLDTINKFHFSFACLCRLEEIYSRLKFIFDRVRVIYNLMIGTTIDSDEEWVDWFFSNSICSELRKNNHPDSANVLLSLNDDKCMIDDMLQRVAKDWEKEYESALYQEVLNNNKPVDHPFRESVFARLVYGTK